MMAVSRKKIDPPFDLNCDEGKGVGKTEMEDKSRLGEAVINFHCYDQQPTNTSMLQRVKTN
jgi:hypothetical protein